MREILKECEILLESLRWCKSRCESTTFEKSFIAQEMKKGMWIQTKLHLWHFNIISHCWLTLRTESEILFHTCTHIEILLYKIYLKKEREVCNALTKIELVAEFVSISLSDTVPLDPAKLPPFSTLGPSPALLLKSLSAPNVSPELLLTCGEK